jgi:hypothetical protein
MTTEMTTTHIDNQIVVNGRERTTVAAKGTTITMAAAAGHVWRKKCRRVSAAVRRRQTGRRLDD